MDGKFLWILFNFQQHRCRCGLEHEDDIVNSFLVSIPSSSRAPPRSGGAGAGGGGSGPMIYDFYIASRLNVSHHSSAEGDCVEEILVWLLLRLEGLVQVVVGVDQ